MVSQVLVVDFTLLGICRVSGNCMAFVSPPSMWRAHGDVNRVESYGRLILLFVACPVKLIMSCDSFIAHVVKLQEATPLSRSCIVLLPVREKHGELRGCLRTVSPQSTTLSTLEEKTLCWRSVVVVIFSRRRAALSMPVVTGIRGSFRLPVYGGNQTEHFQLIWRACHEQWPSRHPNWTVTGTILPSSPLENCGRLSLDFWHDTHGPWFKLCFLSRRIKQDIFTRCIDAGF